MNDLLTPNKIIKSKRKSISLQIKNNGEFIVMAPLRSKEEDIFKFINQKASWIIKKRTESQSSYIKPLTFVDCEQIDILGKTYEITYHESNKVILTENQIVLPKEESKEKLIAFMKRFAKQYLTERAKLIAELFGFVYEKLSINSARTCWGSCSFNNKLHFTYKLIQCPQDVVDYIVLHELCHTKIKNHSQEFWTLVEKCNPYYKTHEKWLKKNRAVIDVV